jgi:hypothetical protein
MTTTEAVLSLEKRRLKAMIEADFPALDEIFSDDLTYTHSSSIVHTKAAYIDAMRRRSFRYADIITADEKVVLTADSALITGSVVIHAEFPAGPQVIDSRYLSVWTRGEGGWKHTAWQSTPNLPQ